MSTPSPKSRPKEDSSTGSHPGQSLAGPATEKDQSNRRAHTRVRLTAQVMVHQIDGSSVGPGIAGTCIDLSQGGFRVRTRKLLHAGQMLAMVMPQKTGGARVLFGLLRNVRYAESGLHELGLQLCGAPSELGISQWVKQCEAPQAA